MAFDFAENSRPIGRFSDIGAWEYSFASSIPLEYAKPKSQIQLLGNPVDDFLTIRVQNESYNRISLEIYNSSGLLIKYLGNSEIRIENQVFRSNVSSLSSGLYFFRLNFGNTSESRKFIKN